jgi:signal peptidase I
VNEKTKNILNLVAKVASWILIGFTVVIMIFTIVSMATLNKNDRNIFGFKFLIVQSDSMSPSEKNADDDVHFRAGDIIIIKDVENAWALQPGDVISFTSFSEVSYMETVTHMIYEVKKDNNGRVVGYVTYGTNTGAIDDAVVEPEYILGKYTGKLPAVGHVFAFIKSTPGYIVCILVPFLLLILYYGINVIKLFKKYKGEQNAILEAEKAEIAEEKRQTEQMLRELQALKEQLAMQGQLPAEPTPTTAPAPTADTTANPDSTPELEPEPPSDSTTEQGITSDETN